MLFEISFTTITNDDGQSSFRRNERLGGAGDRKKERDREIKRERGETFERQRTRERLIKGSIIQNYC